MRKIFVMMSIVSVIATLTYSIWIFLAKPESISIPGINDTNSVRYVAIGDSYTVGQGVAAREAWPSQVVEIAKANGVPLKLVSTIARSGWTTTNLIEQGLAEYDATNAQFVTLMIGANDANQNLTPDRFQTNLNLILDKIAQQVPPEKTVVVTIPNFFVTPAGALRATGENPEAETRELNSIIQNECAQRGIAVVDLFETSRNLGSNPSLLARDKLHPSAAGHLQWASVIAPTVLQVFGK